MRYLRKVTVKKLVDLEWKHWGNSKYKNPITGSDVATTLDILFGGGQIVSTGNVEHVPVMAIYNPYVQRNAKLIGYFTLTNKEMNRVYSSGIVELLISDKLRDSDKILKIAWKLYKNKGRVKL